MKFTFPRLTVRSPSPRTWLGLALIAVSIAGTTWVVSDNADGTGIVLATRFLPAGTVLTSDDVARATLLSGIHTEGLEPSFVVGKRITTDVAPGDAIAGHQLDTTSLPRTVVAVPLGISPATTIGAGSRIELWLVPTDALQPPRLAAQDAIVVATRQGSFGEGDLVDVSISRRDEDAVLSAMGSGGIIIATNGAGGM